MKTLTKEIQDNISPEGALELLKEGNERFLEKNQVDRNLNEQVKETSQGQFPFAVVLGCIDSRVPIEVVFDQGIGDVFSARVAGNIVNEDMLGSMEYACKVAGSKLVVVLGHSKCGAVTAACKGVELGNITPLLEKIKPAVDAVPGEMDADNIEKVVEKNVLLTIERIQKESPILAEMEANGEIKIVGAVYNVGSGEVVFI